VKLLRKIKRISVKFCDYLRPITFFGGGHCDSRPGCQRNLAPPLLLRTPQSNTLENTYANLQLTILFYMMFWNWRQEAFPEFSWFMREDFIRRDWLLRYCRPQNEIYRDTERNSKGYTRILFAVSYFRATRIQHLKIILNCGSI
jgi:hypothetical protein